jgi:hypothetical protein
MSRRTTVRADSFCQLVRQQIEHLRDQGWGYRALQVYVAGIAAPWEFGVHDEFEFHESTGVLIVRDGPSHSEGYDNAAVPEYVFRLESIVATQLV